MENRKRHALARNDKWMFPWILFQSQWSDVEYILSSPEEHHVGTNANKVEGSRKREGEAPAEPQLVITS